MINMIKTIIDHIAQVLKKNVYLSTLAVAILLMLAVINVRAWGSIWHDVNMWLQSGYTVTSKELAENLQYIYDKISEDVSCPEGSLLRYNQSQDKLECFRCPVGSAIKWINGKASCEQ